MDPAEDASEEPLVSSIRHQHQQREKQKSQHTFPDVDNVWCGDGEDDVQPYVGEDGGKRGHTEHRDVLDSTNLSAGYSHDAHAHNDEQIVRRRPHNGRRAQLPRAEVIPQQLYHRQQDLGGRRAKRHQSQIRDGVVPDFDVEPSLLAVAHIHKHLLLHTRHALYRRHEHIGDDGHPEEAPQQAHQIQNRPKRWRPLLLAHASKQRQKQPRAARQVARAHLADGL
mmetsp:Transcript_42869/g.107127  ORF Transcript_42869/g.107127 Transcript_42869/m.107127 type:complete len:224 (-) Transcript_42869:47-718(-)